jgi:hypothetical protein
MGISDRAKLVAELILQDKLSGPAKTAAGNISRLEGATTKAGRGIGLLGGAISTALGVGLERAVSSGIGLVSRAVIAGSESLNRLELATAATNQVLKSTKGVSGQTAAGIQALAAQFETLNPLIGDEFIQAGENMLLTFTNIRGKAFKPATEALLNMNQAMGGGEEGLTKTAIQLGKALNDPAKGMTALRRVGVTFSAEQQKRIKDLQKEGKLYEAQQVILKELSTEFGGQFAKAGETAAASQARLKDAVEDAERALAKGLLPGVGRVRDALTKLLSDPKIQSGILAFGERISGFLTTENINKGIGLLSETFASIKGVVASIPWGAIGDALRIGGVGAKAILDAFNSAPDWLKTAVITGWGLNKLTGGLAGSLFSGLASGLIRGVLGMTAGVVNAKAGVVNVIGAGGVPTPGGGPPVGPTGGGGGLLFNAAKWVLGPVAAAAIGFEIGKALIADQVNKPKASEAQKFKAVLDSGDAEKLAQGYLGIQEQLKTSDPTAQLALIASRIPLVGDALGNVAPELEKQRDVLGAQLSGIRDNVATLKSEQRDLRNVRTEQARAAAVASAQRTRAAQAVTNLAATERADAARAESRSAGLQAAIDRGRQVTQTGLAVLAAKDFSPTVNVTVPITTSISLSQLEKNITLSRVITHTGFQPNYE